MNENTVELLSHFGDDNMIVDVARCSYDKEASNYDEIQNKKLINFLAKNNHWSPFSHPQLHFRITMPIYVERQLMKTEQGRVFNSISGRYVDFSDTYTLIPEGEWRKQSKDSKQGSEGLVDRQEVCDKIQNEVVEVCRKAYIALINQGVSKEQARTILPLNLNTTQIWTGSFYTLIRLCNQRLKPDAQKETGDVVRQMINLVKQIPNNPFKYSLEAFNIK
jgi:thymidylate synthase (FAD)